MFMVERKRSQGLERPDRGQEVTAKALIESGDFCKCESGINNKYVVELMRW